MSKKKLVEPAWVCLDCAKERGARIPEGHRPTFNKLTCGICGKITDVTASRDFGITRNLLKIEE